MATAKSDKQTRLMQLWVNYGSNLSHRRKRIVVLTVICNKKVVLDLQQVENRHSSGICNKPKEMFEFMKKVSISAQVLYYCT